MVESDRGKKEMNKKKKKDEKKRFVWISDVCVCVFLYLYEYLNFGVGYYYYYNIFTFCASSMTIWELQDADTSRVPFDAQTDDKAMREQSGFHTKHRVMLWIVRTINLMVG